MAQLVVAAVLREGRSKSEVARQYGVFAAVGDEFSGRPPSHTL